MIPVVAALLNAGLGILGNAVATKGKDFIQEKLGVDIEDLLGSDEGKIQLAQIQSQNEEALQRYIIESRRVSLEEVEIEHRNTADARDMQKVALAQDDVVSKRFIYWLASGWSIFTSMYIAAITFIEIPLGNVRFADLVLGFLLGTIIATIMNFFFGSSKASQAKDVVIANAMKDLKQ